MKKLLFTLLIASTVVTGCRIVQVSNDSISDIMKTILYVDNKLKNTFMEGYQLYLPRGVYIDDKSDYNLKIKDDNSIYYLYVDTIAYYYKTENLYEEKNDHFYSQKFRYNNIDGYIDIIDNNEYYFVTLMYNYSKIETYVLKNNFEASFMNMCNILSSIKFNDSVISKYVDKGVFVYQEEKFNIFESDAKNDNFLKYEEEYGIYKDKINTQKDNDVIEIDETVE